MGNIKDNVKVEYGMNNDGLGVTIQALFKGMEGLVQSKTVVGEPIEAGGALIIPLIEISAGLASGALVNNSASKNKNNGAGAMSAKMSPVALLIIQDGRTRLVNVKNQDVFTRLLDLIPEAIEKVKQGAVSERAKAEAEALAEADSDNIEVINGD